MIGLDANVLLRYLVQDDPVQSSRATEIVTGQFTEEEPGFVNGAMVEARVSGYILGI
jgi:predicted nucleic-acid-binding protein